MNLVEACELTKKYAKCPKCGCETVGGGTGTLDVDTEDGRFIRTCRCGWKIEIQEDGNGGSARTRWTCPLCHCVVFNSNSCWCCGTVLNGGKP